MPSKSSPFPCREESVLEHELPSPLLHQRIKFPLCYSKPGPVLLARSFAPGKRTCLCVTGPLGLGNISMAQRGSEWPPLLLSPHLWLPISPQSSHTSWLWLPELRGHAKPQGLCFTMCLSVQQCSHSSWPTWQIHTSLVQLSTVMPPSQSLLCPNISPVTVTTATFEPCWTRSSFLSCTPTF